MFRLTFRERLKKCLRRGYAPRRYQTPSRRDYAPEGVGAINPATILVPHNFKELFHVLKAVDMTEQVEQEQTWGVITRRSVRGVTVSDQGSNERKID